ncbi:MAG: hypothetical protein IJF49_00065 [Clostridia bacterium]|nr:hypothetical protein [Clostridia bacterium]
MDESANSLNARSKKTIRTKTAELLRNMLHTIDAASAKAASEAGTMSARERIAALLDPNTFVEIGAYRCRRNEEDDFEGVICGYGAIDERLVFCFAQEFGRKKGAFDDVQAEKIEQLYRMAQKNGAPVIGIFDSAGALVYDGVSALAGYGRVMRCASRASGVIPQIAVIDGVCAGSASAIAAMFDFAIVIKNRTQFYVNSPFLVGESAGTAQSTAESGLAALVAEHEYQAYSMARRLICILPQNNAEGTVDTFLRDDLNRKLEVDALFADANYDMSALVSAIADEGDVMPFYTEYAPELMTALASIGGQIVGVLANCPAERDGMITVAAARKAARFISFCDSFNVPLLTLVDSVGLEVSPDAEGTPYACELARMASAYISAACPKVSVVVGSAYGAAYTLMGSKSLGADIAFALERAAISVLPPDAAVAFLWNDRVEGNTPADARAELEEEWRAMCATPVDAAQRGEIDDIISTAELRQRICAAFAMLAAKSELPPTRRHANLPL